MSLLLCPMCGKNSSLRNFDPEGFVNDIYVQHVRGLGRGRGFKVTSRISILEDSKFKGIRRMIADRAIELVAMLEANGDTSSDEIFEQLGSLEEKEARQAIDEEEKQVALREEEEASAAIYEETVNQLTPLETLQRLRKVENLTWATRVADLEKKLVDERATREKLDFARETSETYRRQSEQYKQKSDAERREHEARLARIDDDLTISLHTLGGSNMRYASAEEKAEIVNGEISSLAAEIDGLLRHVGLSGPYGSLCDKIRMVTDEVLASRALGE